MCALRISMAQSIGVWVGEGKRGVMDGEGVRLGQGRTWVCVPMCEAWSTT